MFKKYKPFCILLLIGILFILVGMSIFFLFLKKDKISREDFSLHYSYVGQMENEYLAVSDGSRFGYVNSRGKEVIKVSFPLIDKLKDSFGNIDLSSLVFKEKMAPFTSDNGKFGLIDEKGKVLIKSQYDTIKVLQKNLILVSKDSFYQFLLANGKEAFSQKFQTVQVFDSFDELFLVTQNDRYGLINTQGQMLLDCKYDQLVGIPEENGERYLFYTKSGDKEINYLYEQGKLVKLPIYGLPSFSKGMIYGMTVDGYYYTYQVSNKKIITFKNSYIALGTFYDGLAKVVNSSNQVGFIDQREKVVIPYQYHPELTMDFTEFGMAVAGRENFVGVIDSHGKEVIPFQYLYIEIIGNNRFLVMKEDQTMMVMDRNGKQVTKQEYDRIEQTTVSSFLITTKKQGDQLSYGVIDFNGKEVLKTKYLDVMVDDSVVIGKVNRNEYFVHWIKENV